MIREAKLQEFYDAGRAMVSANSAGIDDGPDVGGPRLSSDYIHGTALRLQHLAKETEIVNAGENLSGLMGKTGVDAANKHLSDKRAAESRASKASAAETLLLLDLLDQELAPIEDQLAEKYGEDYYEKIALKYLDGETNSRLMQIEDPEERKRAMRDELMKRYKTGEIEIEEPDVRDWLDACWDKKVKLGLEVEATISGVENDKFSLRSTFEAKASPEAETIQTVEAEIDEKSVDKGPDTSSNEMAWDSMLG